VDKTPECDGQADGQTDRIALAITAVCIASNLCDAGAVASGALFETQCVTIYDVHCKFVCYRLVCDLSDFDQDSINVTAALNKLCASFRYMIGTVVVLSS